jgi:hypothetical protein
MCSGSPPPTSTLPSQCTEHNKTASGSPAAVLPFIMMSISRRRLKDKQSSPLSLRHEMALPHSEVFCHGKTFHRPFFITSKTVKFLNRFRTFSEGYFFAIFPSVSPAKENYYGFIYPSLADLHN